MLQRWEEGDHAALDQLIPHVLQDLRHIAQRHLGPGGGSGRTIRTTQLVNDFYLQVTGKSGHPRQWNNRRQFFAFAGKTMRNLIVDHYRSKNAHKRGGGAVHVAFDGVLEVGDPQTQPQGLGDALDDLEKLDLLQSQIVDLRFFVGLSMAEIAKVLELPLSRVKMEWQTARLWLQRELAGTDT